MGFNFGFGIKSNRNRSSSGPDRRRQGQSDDIYDAARRASGEVFTPGTGQLPPGFDRRRFVRDSAYRKQVVDEVKGGWSQGPGSGIPGSVQGALDFFGGDAEAGKRFMNPYQQQVIDEMNKQFAVQNKGTENQMNDAATRAGAFGGSRHGVATGVALGENQRNQNMQVAGLLNQGFEGAGNRAMAAADLGMTAGSPDLWRLNVLKQGVAGQPYRTTSRSRGTEWNASGSYGK